MEGLYGCSLSIIMVFCSEAVMGKIEGTVALGMFGAGYVAGN